MKYFFSALLTLFFIHITTPSYAFDFNQSKRQEAKDAKRWSLSQWLDQKKNIKLMDSWLMYNQPDPYEFFLGADTSSFDQITTINGAESSQSYRNYRGSFGAFVTIVGLYGEYESSNEEAQQWKALFMLRLLGSSDQSTNLTLHYGLMNREFGTDNIQHQVGGGKINLYLLKALALHGMYEYILKATSEAGTEYEGYRVEGGVHIEYGALRIYGTWYNEKLDYLNTLNQETLQERKGILFGTRLYF